MSAAGEALHRLPASVARFRIWAEPTTRAASASAGKWRRTARVGGDVGHHGPGADDEAPAGVA